MSDQKTLNTKESTCKKNRNVPFEKYFLMTAKGIIENHLVRFLLKKNIPLD